ncbi:TetR/AcrR family transcriptional regulator [Hoeflea prorocentri]|uniref:TetR/AcrR family transcriptional regulator n=1 Tax=Hoeflea prorocentri TaxID=1922333 RepID=A0A9X3UG50_9HYPH|nr:TetR/AcrR family transcriptional regulator [Hoeflea prorocentri]MCY6380122.1 TetR/AcrR family transcriptional regulator [Hoeflea prorocentri]MDA5397922.1 TetR/AcrR family transcriptional regulator [Hoeflea prorocentri]
MPRPKSYDRQKAVESACKAFWAHGYQALGVRELEELTGLNQFAIRSEFGGKEGLYLEALKFYCDAAISEAMAPMKRGGLDEIIVFLNNLVADNSVTSSPWGCLVVNTGIENARVQSPRLDDIGTFYWGTLEDHFRQALSNALVLGEIDEATEVDTMASGLVTAVMGIHAKNRSLASHKGGCNLAKLLTGHLQSMRTS